MIQRSLCDIRIETDSYPMNQLRVAFIKDPATCKSRAEVDQYTLLRVPDGRFFKVSDRFWTSWCSLQSQGRSVFDLFAHGEVFERITSKRKDRVRLAMEIKRSQVSGYDTAGTLISCTNPTKPLLPVSEAVDLIERYEGTSATYGNGVVSATFDCPFQMPYNIAGEDYKTRFAVQMSVDGYGLPTAYLTLLRQICQNGVIGMGKAFKTQFQLGKGDDDIASVLDRAMSTFSAEEGFHSFKQRMEAGAKSWASLHEASALYKVMNQAMVEDETEIQQRINIIEAYDGICGDPLKYYGLTNRQELSVRKARTIPVNTTIYELITFASEISTHKLQQPMARNRVNAWVGDLISSEYDLELSRDEIGEFRDFFTGRV